MEHTGRKSWLRTKDGITFLHDGVGQGKIEIPELHDIILGAFGKQEGDRIKFQEPRYESILIGGMDAGVITHFLIGLSSVIDKKVGDF